MKPTHTRRDLIFYNKFMQLFVNCTSQKLGAKSNCKRQDFFTIATLNLRRVKM